MRDRAPERENILVDALGVEYGEFKDFIEASIQIHNDASHILLGMAIYILAALVLRQPITRWPVWAVVAMIAVANEAYDLSIEIWHNEAMQWGESAKDIVLTLAIPTVIALIGRFRPAMLHDAAGSADV